VPAALAVLLSAPAWCGAADWQYQVPFESEKGPGRVLLWIPPASQTIRGLVVGGEAEFCVDPSVRRACAEEHLGLVVFRPHAGGLFHFWKDGGAVGERYLKAMTDLARRSAHPELQRVPWITMGHSTAGIFCRNVAYWRPERVAGVIHYKSGEAATKSDNGAALKHKNPKSKAEENS
jgi:hypothetical protein